MAFTRDGVYYNRTIYVGAAEKTYGLIDYRNYPIRRAALVYLERRLIKEIGGVFKPQISEKILVKVLGGRILHTLRQTDKLPLLRGHINYDICRQTLLGVFYPFEDVAVSKRGNSDGRVFIVYLRGIRRYDKLRDLIRQISERSLGYFVCRGAVKHGNA